MDTLLRDLRFGLRLMKKRKAITAAAVVCLALAIGATTVVYTIVDGVLLRPLPYEEPDELFLIWNQFPNQGISETLLSGGEFTDLGEQSERFETVAGLIPWYFNLTEGENPERLVAARLSSHMFRMLGTNAAMGRTFDPAEVENNASVTVLSHELWKRRFDRDPNIVGRAILLDESPYTVIGVMPESFRFMITNTDLWVPLVVNPNVPRHIRGVRVIGRLRDDTSRTQAQAELDAIAGRFAESFPGVYPLESGYGMTMQSLNDNVVGSIRPTLMALLGAVTLVLLIGCINVANLLLAQATTREREVSVRAALGAGRWTLLRQMLTESVLLAIMGGSLGILLARWGLEAIKNTQATRVPRLHQIDIDLRILLISLAISIVTGVACGLIPAFRGARTNLFGVLKEGGRTSADSKSHPVRNTLVIAQIVLALVVLICAGLMVRSFNHLQKVDPGFRKDNVLTVQMFLPRNQYPSPRQHAAFSDQLLERVRQIPGAQSAGLVSNLPLGPFDVRGEVVAENQEQEPGQANIKMGWRCASPDYFESFGIPKLQGRTFNAFDRADSEPVAIVDAAAAARLWPDDSPIDKRLMLLGTSNDVWRTVVGVVGDVRHDGLQSPTSDQIYIPFDQIPSPFLGLVIRTAGDPLELVPALRSATHEIDPIQPLGNINTATQLVEDSLSLPRFNQLLLGLFGIAALILAAIGVYGVMAYSVGQRKRELGLRMALGAHPSDNLKMVMVQALRLTAVGVVIGLGLAWVLGRVFSGFLGGMLHGIAIYDAATFISVPIGLLLLSAIASLLPAQRATRVSPIESLRDE